MNRLTLNILIILSPFLIFAQKKTEVSKNVNKIVNQIAKNNILMNSAVYFSGIKPEQYTRFEKLKQKATFNELAQLTNHKNGVVRCYAFWALAYIDTSNTIIQILKQHLNDTTTINTQFGCNGGATKVGDFFIELMTPQYVNLEVRKLTNKERKEIDNELLYNKQNNLSSKSELLLKIEPSEENYDRIREIAIKENNPIATFTLSKFKKQQDIELVQNLLKSEETEYWGVSCIINFPDTVFKHDIEKIQQREIVQPGQYSITLNRVLYKAIVQYKDDWSVRIIQKTLNECHPYLIQNHQKYIWIAIKKFPNPIYDNFFNSIKLEDFELITIDREIEID